MVLLSNTVSDTVTNTDGNKYTGKCLELLQTNQFMKLNHDPTKSIEGKI